MNRWCLLMTKLLLNILSSFYMMTLLFKITIVHINWVFRSKVILKGQVRGIIWIKCYGAPHSFIIAMITSFVNYISTMKQCNLQQERHPRMYQLCMLHLVITNQQKTSGKMLVWWNCFLSLNLFVPLFFTAECMKLEQVSFT